jgi:hypothetical protein
MLHFFASPTSRAKFLLLLACTAGSGCSEATDLTNFSDEGDICVLQADEEVNSDDDDDASGENPAERSLDIHVLLADCLSGCSKVEAATCTVELQEDDLLVVHAHGRVSTPRSADFCPSVCIEVKAACSTPELRVGTYRVRYGDEELALEIPSKGQHVATNEDACN